MSTSSSTPRSSATALPISPSGIESRIQVVLARRDARLDEEMRSAATALIDPAVEAANAARAGQRLAAEWIREADRLAVQDAIASCSILEVTARTSRSSATRAVAEWKAARTRAHAAAEAAAINAIGYGSPTAAPSGVRQAIDDLTAEIVAEIMADLGPGLEQAIDQAKAQVVIDDQRLADARNTLAMAHRRARQEGIALRDEEVPSYLRPMGGPKRKRPEATQILRRERKQAILSAKQARGIPIIGFRG